MTTVELLQALLSWGPSLALTAYVLVVVGREAVEALLRPEPTREERSRW